MLDLHRQLTAAKTPDEQTQLRRAEGRQPPVWSTDQRIDRLVGSSAE